MSLGAKVTPRYLLARVANALDAVRKDLPSSGTVPASSLFQRFQEAYKQQLTTVLAFTGVAMAPALNPAALTNSSSWEKLVVRLIPLPSPRNIGVGDVVAFNSPFNQHNPHGVMVRRVAALENHPMLSDEDGEGGEVMERIPPGHCWVLADNEALSPADVIDSRAFGYLDMNLITGRVIYRVQDMQQYGPVANSPLSEAADAAVIESEVDVDALSAGIAAADAAEPAAKQQQQQEQPPPAQPQQQEQEQQREP